MKPDFTESAKRLISLYPKEAFTFPHFGSMPHRVALLAALIELEYNTPNK